MSGWIEEVTGTISAPEISASISLGQEISAPIASPELTATVRGSVEVAATISAETIVSGQGGGRTDPEPDPDGM